MNITLICGHYLPALGYLEVHLARALADLGHGVSVVTTSAVPKYVAHLQERLEAGTEHDGPVKVVRLAPQFEIGQVVSARGLKAAVLSENPDLLIVIGLGKRFPKPVFGLGIPVISLFGDNLHSYARRAGAAGLKNRVQFDLLKASTYKTAIDQSAALVAYTPESFEAAAAMLGGRYAEKLRAQTRFISLGFDPAQFYFDPALRQKMRSKHGLTDADRVLITSTRVVAEKGLEAVVSAAAALPAHWQWWVVGGDGGAYSKSFESGALAALGPSRFRLFPYQDRDALSALFHTADAALYTVPAISVFEVAGAGLPLVIPKAASLQHLAAQEALARSVDMQGEGFLVEALSTFDFGTEARQERAALARDAYSWTSIAEQLLRHADSTQKGHPA